MSRAGGVAPAGSIVAWRAPLSYATVVGTESHGISVRLDEGGDGVDVHSITKHETSALTLEDGH